jgi:ribonuclease T2
MCLTSVVRYWINQGAPNKELWAHEFSKHGTCYSTFDVPCYGPAYVQHQEMVDFYETAIKYYRRLPTWSWLAEAGITPSNTTNYSLSDVQAALMVGYGALPYLGCSGPKYNKTTAGRGSSDDGHIYLDEAWYYFYVRKRWILIVANYGLGQRKATGRRLGSCERICLWHCSDHVCYVEWGVAIS